MARAYPPDVVVLDTDGLLHARLGRGKQGPQILHAKSYRLGEGTFTSSVVTPELANEAALAEALRRLRMESGKWERVSLLLPDSWFRINILDLPSLPQRNGEAFEVVRWSLKRTLPIPPEELRVAYEVLSTATDGSVKVFVLSALDKTLASLERVFATAGFEVVLIEPVGLNIWNAITVREAATTKDRLFLYVRDTDFTTAVFRGQQPLFIRSRNLSGERTLAQEIRLSASYLRDTLQANGIETCYVAGRALDGELSSAIRAEFGAPVQTVSLNSLVESYPSDVAAHESELAACTGVFTG
jgi:Tfp pilus assembly PilM family ATPase